MIINTYFKNDVLKTISYFVFSFKVQNINYCPIAFMNQHFFTIVIIMNTSYIINCSVLLTNESFK